MSADVNKPVDVVRTYCDAWVEGDVATVVSLYHEDLTLEWPGRSRLAGTHTGQQASLEALLELQGLTNRVPAEIIQILEGPDSVIALVLERWTSPDDASEVLEHTRALEFTVQDAKLRTCRIFESAQAEIDEWLGNS